MAEFSIGVGLAWQIAASEAVNSHSEFIEKEHVLIGTLSIEKESNYDNFLQRMFRRKMV